MANRSRFVTALSAHPGFRIAILAPMLALGVIATAYAAKPPRCTDVPISMTFLTPSVPAAIWNDAGPAYQNGVNGVKAVIHLNSACDGTRDATLDLGSSTRTLWMQYPAAIDGSIIPGQGGPASFAGGPAFATKAFFNVHNVVGYGLPAGTTTYYTKISSTFPGPDGSSYRLALYPDSGTCPDVCAPVPDGLDANVNSPEQGAWAKVTVTASDTWLVEGDLVTGDIVERGTLFFLKKNGTKVHFGQYSIPFKIEIKALAPLP